MTRLLWLITICLGLQLLYEQSWEVGRVWGTRVRRLTFWLAVVWFVALGWTVAWFWGQP